MGKQQDRIEWKFKSYVVTMYTVSPIAERDRKCNVSRSNEEGMFLFFCWYLIIYCSSHYLLVRDLQGLWSQVNTIGMRYKYIA